MHEHTEACGSTPEVDSLLVKLNNPTNKLTERQFRELRNRYFTIRHIRVPDCGHKADSINEPTHRNCEYCWFFFLESHPDLVKVADEAYVEHGAAFIDKLRGRKFRVMFTRFMATKLALKKEMDERNESTQSDRTDLRQTDSIQSGDQQPRG